MQDHVHQRFALGVPSRLGPVRPCGQSRGAAYVTTLLTLVVTATIVFALVTLVVGNLREARIVVDTASAQEQVQKAQAGFEARLEADPWRFYAEVDVAERARVCGPTGEVVQPGEPWDLQACGSRWVYTQSDMAAAAIAVGEPAVRLELTPPSVDRATLGVNLLVNTNGVEQGRALTYTTSSPADFTVHTDGDLELDRILQSGSTVTIDGFSAYTPGTMLLDLTSPIGLPDSLFAAEGTPAFVGATSPSGRYFSTVPGGVVEDVRDLVDDPRRTAALHAASITTRRVGCLGEPGETPAIDQSRSSRLCLESGWVVTDTSGAGITVPDDVVAWSVRSERDSGGVAILRVDYSTEEPGVSDCVAPCSLPATAVAEDIPAGTHPGDDAFWTPLGSGEFHLPRNGVVVTGQDTYVGRCGAPAFTTTADDCEVSELFGNLTLLTGSLDAPADIWLAGEWRTRAGAAGLVATGELIIPYFARTPGGQLTIEANLQAFGLGSSSDPGWDGEVRTFPSVVCDSAGAPCEDNVGERLTLQGSLAAPRLDLAYTQFQDVLVTPAGTTAAAPPAFLPTFNPVWLPASSGPLTAVDVCGGRSCTNH